MSRVVCVQDDLFAVAPPASRPAAEECPIECLRAMLALVRSAECLPWPTLPDAMAAEYRAMAWAREAGEEGPALLSAIFEQTERLLSATD